MNKVLGDLVAQHAARLTGADTRLLDVLMQDPMRAALDTGKDISARAGVHPTSAIRLARKLGFAGYPEFRAFLQAAMVEGHDLEDPATRIAARLLRAEEGGLLSSILDSEIDALQQLRHAVRDPDIRDFAQTLLGARRIFTFGLGHAASLSALITLRLCRSGYDAVDLAALPRLAESLSTWTSEDVLWLVSLRGPGERVRALRAVAAERGVRVLLLSDASGLRIEPPPHLGITISRGEAGQSQSLVVPMTVANAVILDLAAIDGGRSLRALTTFRKTRASLPGAIAS
ncbi:MurR/RpiR family transcriptional regulator [Falsirhodobacter deserti]|uniref:MurR/RpiR family transcriptional regulator n=1 Tax=Falsirhodobacter deserti TaxID=1365611 RepID=UPI000FE3A2DB|nr:MurR/RpiR family transcriptional regulator [Falsirhodobacter deserti]